MKRGPRTGASQSRNEMYAYIRPEAY
jgi:hypothetical protein